jgi:hypothetical protein
VLSDYRALGDLPQAREQLATQPWTHWADAALATLGAPHLAWPRHARGDHALRPRHVHPVPGTLQFMSQIGLQRPSTQRSAIEW